ncbi:hypothetical protein [Capnocytophaga stomatis]|uniref:Uncharacterized protein n=1 Tax=Capnocytophaga stomatis TaxID=1848904 RepID=A0ABW8Q9K5_9FLAO|nr:hypothetical protein [Capnocytophaga stomatis]GIJ95667.1 hypothetical protein CAPN001_02360 [Capnocytophaga stomatis]
MKYAVMIGSNMFIGTSGVLRVEVNGRLKEFLNVREIFRERSEGSYLAVDCDIKDTKNKREIKLFKNKPVAIDKSVKIQSSHNIVEARREDNSTIIKIEQITPNDHSLPKSGPIPEMLKKYPIDAILRITGDFYAGDYHIFANNYEMIIGGGITIAGGLSVGTDGMILTSMGFGM